MKLVNSAANLKLQRLRLNKFYEKKVLHSEYTFKEAIASARKTAADLKEFPELIFDQPIWKREFIKALDQTGYIRHDLHPIIYHVMVLYSKIDNHDFLTDNRCYENIVFSDDDWNQLAEVLGRVLEQNEAKVMRYLYGFDDDKLHTYTEAGEHFGISRQRAYMLEVNSLRKLRVRRNFLPPIPFFRTKCEGEDVNTQSTPKTTSGKVSLDSSVNALELYHRSYSPLHNVGIHTIRDVLNYNGEWHLIRGLGLKGRTQIEEKMRALGYDDFSTLPKRKRK